MNHHTRFDDFSPSDLPFNYAYFLAPLIRELQTRECLHLSLVGSSCYKSILAVNDIDLLVVMTDLDKKTYISLVESAQHVCSVLNTCTDFDWIVETRRGPFKPENKRKQIHLLIDCQLSLKSHLPQLLDYYDANGRLILGVPVSNLLSEVRRPDYNSERLALAIELDLIIQSWKEERIFYKEWIFSPLPVLQLQSMPISSRYHLKGLIQQTLCLFQIFYPCFVRRYSREAFCVQPPFDLGREILKCQFSAETTVMLIKEIYALVQVYRETLEL